MTYRYISTLPFTIVVSLIGSLGLAQSTYAPQYKIHNLSLFDSLCVNAYLFEFSDEAQEQRRIYVEDELKKATIPATTFVSLAPDGDFKTHCDKANETTAYVQLDWNYDGVVGLLKVYADYQGLEGVIIYQVGPYYYRGYDDIESVMNGDMDKAIGYFIEDWLASRTLTPKENEK
jgi:hypothetical protein